MNDARAQRPTPGPTAVMFSLARQAIADAELRALGAAAREAVLGS